MKKKLFTLMMLLLTVASGVWAETGTEVIKAGSWNSGQEYSGTCVTGASIYSSGDGGGNIQNYSPSNKGVKLNVKSTTVYVGSGSIKSGYVLLTVNSDYKVTSLKLEGTSNSTNTIILKGVYADVDKENLATSLAEATNLYSDGVTFPSKNTDYVSSEAVAMEAIENIVLLFDNNSDSQMRAIITLEWEKTPELTGAWKIGGDEVTEANVIQGAAAPTMPIFTVGSTSGAPTASDYNVEYSETGTSGIFTYTAGVPTGISTATAGTATITATLTTNSASFLTPATNTFEYSVTVAAASAPSFDSFTADETTVERGGSVTLTADVSGMPTPTIKWYANTVDNNTSGTEIAGETALTYSPATTTVGTTYYYAVASNSQGDTSSSTIAISVKPKAPTLTAGGKFISDSKSVTITKADGEAVEAEIKYSTNGGSSWNTYSNPLSISATTTVTAKVVQAGLESDEASATYTKIVKSDLVSISAATTWDWSKVTANSSHELYSNNGIQLTGSSTPDYNTEFVMEDFADGYFYTLADGFDGTTIAFKGEYPCRYGNRCQNGTVKFNTTVPGVITVKFNDTGSSASTTAVKRYLVVNGVNTGYWTSRENNSTEPGVAYSAQMNVVTDGIYVPAGDVTITGSSAIQIYYVQFEPLADGDVVQVTSAGWASFSSSKALDFTGTGVTAYIAKAKDDQNVTLTEISKVPANTGIVVSATAGTYAIPTLSVDADGTTGNLLKPWLTAGTPTDSKYYTLAVSGGNPVFKKSSGGTLAAGKSYLVMPGTGAPSLGVDFGSETTGVSEVRSQKEDVRGEYFNLNGQRVAQPTKGLYIVNGRKVVVK